MIAVISLLLVLTISVIVIVIVSRARGIGHPSCVLAQGPSLGVMVSPIGGLRRGGAGFEADLSLGAARARS